MWRKDQVQWEKKIKLMKTVEICVVSEIFETTNKLFSAEFALTRLSAHFGMYEAIFFFRMHTIYYVFERTFAIRTDFD